MQDGDDEFYENCPSLSQGSKELMEAYLGFQGKVDVEFQKEVLHTCVMTDRSTVAHWYKITYFFNV